MGSGLGERERKRERQRQTDRDRQTDRQTDRSGFWNLYIVAAVTPTWFSCNFYFIYTEAACVISLTRASTFHVRKSCSLRQQSVCTRYRDRPLAADGLIGRSVPATETDHWE